VPRVVVLVDGPGMCLPTPRRGRQSARIGLHRLEVARVAPVLEGQRMPVRHDSREAHEAAPAGRRALPGEHRAGPASPSTTTHGLGSTGATVRGPRRASAPTGCGRGARHCRSVTPPCARRSPRRRSAWCVAFRRDPEGFACRSGVAGSGCARWLGLARRCHSLGRRTFGRRADARTAPLPLEGRGRSLASSGRLGEASEPTSRPPRGHRARRPPPVGGGTR